MLALFACTLFVGVQPGRAQNSPGPQPPNEARLEERIKQLESLIRKMPDPDYVGRLEEKVRQMPDANEIRRMRATIQQLSDRMQQLPAAAQPAAPASSLPAPPPNASGDARPVLDLPNPVRGLANFAPFTAHNEGADMPSPPRREVLRSLYGSGFQWASADDEFVLQYNNFTMIDGRVNAPQHQSLVSDGVNFPLALNTLSGRATRLVEGTYTFGSSFAQPGANAIKSVFAFITVPLDPRFNLRAGKQRIPFSYEFYLTPFSGLMNTDWSIFFQNYINLAAPGFDAFGQLFDKRMTYSVGVFDDAQFGASRNILDFNDVYATKAFAGLINFQPFLHAGIPWLERFNIGGSAFAGNQQGGPSPLPLIAGLNSYGVPFLSYNNDVRQSGHLAFWALSAAYFSGPLSLQAEWESGYQGLSRVGHPGRTQLGIQSYYVQAAYILTGETTIARGMIKPKRPVDFRKGHVGFGAWEVAARYNPFEVGSAVFSQGLADPNLWTNRLWGLDVGLNWYWNEYLKFTLNWKHLEFADPVFSHPGVLQATAQQFTLRALISF